MLLKVRLSLNWASCATEFTGETPRLDDATPGRWIRTKRLEVERLHAARLSDSSLCDSERLNVEQFFFGLFGSFFRNGREKKIPEIGPGFLLQFWGGVGGKSKIVVKRHPSVSNSALESVFQINVDCYFTT